VSVLLLIGSNGFWLGCVQLTNPLFTSQEFSTLYVSGMFNSLRLGMLDPLRLGMFNSLRLGMFNSLRLRNVQLFVFADARCWPLRSSVRSVSACLNWDRRKRADEADPRANRRPWV